MIRDMEIYMFVIHKKFDFIYFCFLKIFIILEFFFHTVYSDHGSRSPKFSQTLLTSSPDSTPSFTLFLENKHRKKEANKPEF